MCMGSCIRTSYSIPKTCTIAIILYLSCSYSYVHLFHMLLYNLYGIIQTHIVPEKVTVAVDKEL